MPRGGKALAGAAPLERWIVAIGVRRLEEVEMSRAIVRTSPADRLTRGCPFRTAGRLRADVAWFAITQRTMPDGAAGAAVWRG